MKKLIILILAVLMLIPGISFAEIAWKSGVGYSVADSKVNFLSTVEVAKWKDVTVEAGYAGSAQNTQDKVVAVVSYPLIKLGDYVDLPVLDLIECNIGIYGGVGRVTGSNEFDWGISASILSIKF
jgi:hypothetical protein